ncbi:MAG: adenylate/guanylate cyclase domain-containing protein [Alsobacter sp.]
MSASRSTAAIAFVDLAGFSAATDVYGDELALKMLGVFEQIVRDALGGEAPLKWIGDEVMLAFDDGAGALAVLGELLNRCREEPRIPLTRTGLHAGPVLRRGDDMFGSTVNIAAQLTAMARPGELLTTRPCADLARTSGIDVEDRGEQQVRSVAEPIHVYAIALARAADPQWIDPVCKMHAPLQAYRRAPGQRWFCSPVCAEAYARNPEAYPD